MAAKRVARTTFRGNLKHRDKHTVYLGVDGLVELNWVWSIGQEKIDAIGWLPDLEKT